jgi:hypothetical protein
VLGAMTAPGPARPVPCGPAWRSIGLARPCGPTMCRLSGLGPELVVVASDHILLSPAIQVEAWEQWDHAQTLLRAAPTMTEAELDGQRLGGPAAARLVRGLDDHRAGAPAPPCGRASTARGTRSGSPVDGGRDEEPSAPPSRAARVSPC